MIVVHLMTNVLSETRIPWLNDAPADHNRWTEAPNLTELPSALHAISQHDGRAGLCPPV